MVTQSTMLVEREARCEAMTVQIARFEMGEKTRGFLFSPDVYQINMCLTPRPLQSRGGYQQRWGPHRFDRLGDIFLVPPGETLTVASDGGDQASLLCLLEKQRVDHLLGCALEWTDQQLALTLDVTNIRIRNLLARLTEELRHPGFASGPLLDALGGALCVELGRFCLEIETEPARGGLASWRLRLIDERLEDVANIPSLDELADLCRVSVRQLTRGFRVSRGCSIGAHIERRRIEAAKRLLVSGETVKTVAASVGYATAATFSYSFRKAVGATPNSFRQRQVSAPTALSPE